MATMIVDDGNKNLMAWKCSTEDFMFGTQLVVHESQQAVFFRDGQIVEILGPGRHTLETENFPFLRKLTKLRFGRYFHCEVYFVNHSIQKNIPWGTRERVNVFIEVEEGQKLPLKLGASGGMDLQVDPDQVAEFLTYLLGTETALERSDINALFGSMMSTKIKTHLAKALQEEDRNIFSLDQHLEEFSQRLGQRLQPEFEQYGLLLKGFHVADMAYPYDDPVFQQAKLLYEQRYTMNAQQDLEFGLEKKQALHDVDLTEIQKKKSRIEAETEAERTAIVAHGEAIRRNYEGISSIQEHQFDTLNHMIDAGAMAGAAGGGTPVAGVGGGMSEMTGMMGDMMKMGMGMHMMKEMSGVMKDAMSAGTEIGGSLNANMNLGGMTGVQAGMPITAFGAMASQEAAVSQDNNGKEADWTCDGCGRVNPADHGFCGGCGQAKPVPKVDWTCPKCGRTNPGDNNFCGGCGTAKPEEPKEWFCGKCGKKNAADSNFCGGCGQPRA